MSKKCQVNGIIRVPAHSGGFRVWRIVGIYFGGEKQEDVVEIETLDRAPNTEGRMCVPAELLEATEGVEEQLALTAARLAESQAELAQLREQLASAESERDHAQDALEAASERLDKLAATVGELETLSQIAKPSPVDWRAVLCEPNGGWDGLLVRLDGIADGDSPGGKDWAKHHHARLTEALAQHEAAQATPAGCACCNPPAPALTPTDITITADAPVDRPACDKARVTAERIVDRLFQSPDGVKADYLDLKSNDSEHHACWTRGGAVGAIMNVLLQSELSEPSEAEALREQLATRTEERNQATVVIQGLETQLAALVAEVRGLLGEDRPERDFCTLVEGLYNIANLPTVSSGWRNWLRSHARAIEAFLARHPEPSEGNEQRHNAEIAEVRGETVVCWIEVSPGTRVKAELAAACFGDAPLYPGVEFVWISPTERVEPMGFKEPNPNTERMEQALAGFVDDLQSGKPIEATRVQVQDDGSVTREAVKLIPGDSATIDTSLPWPLNGEWGPANKIDREGVWKFNLSGGKVRRYVRRTNGRLWSYFDSACSEPAKPIGDYATKIQARLLGPLPSAEGEGA